MTVRTVRARPAPGRWLSWTPVRRGEIFCAPACGAGCRWSDHEAAKRKAVATARRLGPGWEPHVWENLGWHWKCQFNGRDGITLQPSPRGYVAHRGWASISYGASPGAAVRSVVKKLRAQIRALERVLEGLPGIE